MKTATESDGKRIRIFLFAILSVMIFFIAVDEIAGNGSNPTVTIAISVVGVSALFLLFFVLNKYVLNFLVLVLRSLSYVFAVSIPAVLFYRAWYWLQNAEWPMVAVGDAMTIVGLTFPKTGLLGLRAVFEWTAALPVELGALALSLISLLLAIGAADEQAAGRRSRGSES